uniref:Uncharacterized protein n=1 Tax=Arundo donax TaxID=35708 RepID=A0A0A9B0B5_ARUDO
MRGPSIPHKQGYRFQVEKPIHQTDEGSKQIQFLCKVMHQANIGKEHMDLRRETAQI